MPALSLRVYAYSFLYGVVKSTYSRRAKPETFSLSEQIWNFSKHIYLTYHRREIHHVHACYEWLSRGGTHVSAGILQRLEDGVQRDPRGVPYFVPICCLDESVSEFVTLSVISCGVYRLKTQGNMMRVVQDRLNQLYEPQGSTESLIRSTTRQSNADSTSLSLESRAEASATRLEEFLSASPFSLAEQAALEDSWHRIISVYRSDPS